ncbi:hypothetical protein [Streptomyces sp. I05A-00742]|uniref:hypothetical protein n=1 Tax=Streptomyces sp. I05A-00742 TaxID=2732853 RepID=UPI0014877BD0|nr:hypothetical protein [Streptomyces sp. I05A-00742]
MAFGRNRNTEPPLDVVDWRDVGRFVIGFVEREQGPGTKRPVLGDHAVRVPRRDGQRRINPPCAFLAGRSGVSAIYEDRERQRLLCTIDRSEEEAEGERRHPVRDAEDREIGVIRRIPSSKKLLRHTWRIEQPGHPEIVGRNKWAAISPQDAALRAVGKVVEGLLDSAFSGGDPDGGDGRAARDRTLLWVADGAEVMQSVGSGFSSIKAGWLDRRLAFAMAVLGDR